MTRKKIINIATLFLFIGSLFLTIGYAQVAYDLNVSGNISMNSQNGVVVKNVTEAAKVGTNTSGTIKNYVATTLTNAITLDENGSSYIIYAVQVENTDASSYKFVNVLPDVSSLQDNIQTYTNRFIVPSVLTSSEVSTLFPSATNTISLNDTLPGSSSRTFYLKYSYDSSVIDNGTVASTYQTLETGLLNFSFKKIYSITYTNITNNSYPTTIAHGENLVVTFTGDIPPNVAVTGTTSHTTYVKGTDFTYANNTLTFNNVTENLEITKAEVGIRHDTVATTYDHTNLPANDNVIFDQVAGAPHVITDADGKVISFEYTTASAQNPVSFTPGHSIDTGVLAFDGEGYTIHLEYTMDTSQNTSKQILTALKKLNGNKYAGFVLYVSSATQYYFNATVNGTNINNTAFGARMGSGWGTTSGSKNYTFDLTYVPSPKAVTIELSPITSGDSPYQANSNALSYFPDSLDEATIYLGGNTANTNRDVTMTVTAFSVVKN